MTNAGGFVVQYAYDIMDRVTNISWRTSSGAILGGFAFSCLWGILEMHQQEKRVLRGWFPENPKRHEYYESLRNRK